MAEDSMPKRRTTSSKARRHSTQHGRSRNASHEPQCGLCGKRTNLTKTECCGKWICDDADQYVLFSYAKNSCYRNHDRYTLCSFHHNEGHAGEWKTCEACRQEFETEMYVWYGTNEFNFETLEHPPEYEPTKCAKCHRIIRLGEDGYTVKGDEYFCEKCMDSVWPLR